MTALEVLSAGPALSVQDRGRPGHHAMGLTRGGAADPVALAEGAALLGQSANLAALEMTGMGGSFLARQNLRIALTGAEMRTTLDGAPLRWNTSHDIPKGSRLTIGGAITGTFGYLHLSGGIDTPVIMGARATHAPAGLGRLLQPGDTLPVGSPGKSPAGMTLIPDARLSGGTLRFVASMQTDSFDQATLARFQSAAFNRDPRSNRQGVRLTQDGPGFFADGALSVVSEVIVPGDIQISGDGDPFVLGPDCQTTGGYPRIGTVIPADLPRVAQAQTGTAFRFEQVTLEEAGLIEIRFRAAIAALPGKVSALIRNPASMTDLLSYSLISGAVSATDNPFAQE